MLVIILFNITWPVWVSFSFGTQSDAHLAILIGFNFLLKKSLQTFDRSKLLDIVNIYCLIILIFIKVVTNQIFRNKLSMDNNNVDRKLKLIFMSSTSLLK